MPPVSVTIFASDPGNYFLEDDGTPGNNFSRIRFPDGTTVSFEHPTDDLFFDPSVAGINLTINLIDSLGTSRFSTGDFADPLSTPESIAVRSLLTSAGVTLVANLYIRESGSDLDPDIRASTLLLSAGTGIGTAGNALETQVSVLEAETTTGGINIRNFGTVSIGGLSDEVDGLDVVTSGNIRLETFGAIVLADESGPETIHGGTTSGNVTLIANGVDSDIISIIDQDSISAPRGNINLTAGRDIGFGLIGSNFDNDVRASGTITFNPGRDLLLDGFADIASDDFGQGTGGNVIVNAGRNIGLLAVAGTDAGILASGSAGADIILTTGPGGALTLNSGNGTAPFASLISNSGDVIANADRILIGTMGAISTVAPTGEVILRPATEGWSIDLGSATDAAFALELSDAELDRIFTNSLILGGPDAGPVTVSSAIAPLNAVDLTIQSGVDVTVNGVAVTVGGDLTLRAGDDIMLVAGSVVSVGGILTGFVDFGNTDPGTGGSAFVDAGFATPVQFFGNADGDTLSGGAGNDVLAGLGGADLLNGHVGNDTLDGGGGGDTMTGGLGDDTYIVNHADDAAVEVVGEGIDEVQSLVDYVLLADFENLTLLGTGDINGTGNALANDITGNSGANFLIGRGEADVLSGGAGNDTLDGGGSGDTMSGGLGNDTYIIDASDGLIDGGGIDTVQAGFNYTLLADFENLILLGTGDINGTGNALANDITGNSGLNSLVGDGGNDSLVGGSGNDELNGGSGDDQLNGGSGGDELIGGPGDDTLTGGVGADRYRFQNALDAATNVDRITDFSGNDVIHLDDAIFSSIGATLNAFEFRTGASAADADDRIIYNSATGAIFYDGDGAGGAAQIRFATLDPGLALSNVDFLMV